LKVKTNQWLGQQIGQQNKQGTGKPLLNRVLNK